MKRQPSIISNESRKEIFSLDLITESKCTTSCFGHDEIVQECYQCIYCDPKKRLRFCRVCYDKCHRQCRETCEENYSPANKIEISSYTESFACDCGIWLKHIVKPIEKKEIISCPLSTVDQEFLNGQFFYCEDHRRNLCSMCYFICHKNCLHKSQTHSNEHNSQVCECTASNHTIFNEFTFQIPIFDYQTEVKTSFWPIQMINLMFSSGKIFQELSTLFKDTIENYNPKIIFPKDHPFPYLLEQFSNTFNRKFKTFYYHRKIEEMFPFTSLIKFMKDLNIKNQEMALVKFRLMFILLFAHLKKDFAKIKTYTSIDFLICTMVERIKLKKFIFTKSIFTKEIHEKYEFTENSCGLLKSIALDDFCPFMEVGIKQNLLNVLEFQDELEIGLKFICFLLKKMLFSIDDLKKLIKTLYNFHEEFINGIKFTDIDTISTWLDLFNAFSEIFYMISASYNDQVVEEYLDTGKFSETFIHSKSEHGQLLFKMITKSCIVVAKHYKLMIRNEMKNSTVHSESNRKRKIEKRPTKKRRINPNGVPFKKPDRGILYEKVIKLFHESLKIFAVTDNHYYYQLTKLTPEITDIYYDGVQLINTLNLNSKKNKGVVLKNTAFDMVNELEKLLQKLFLNSYDDTVGSTIVLEFLSEYSIYIKRISEHVSDYLVDRSDLNEANYKFIFDVLNKYEYMNSFLIKNELNFNYEKLITELIFSNIDDISLKILIFFSDRRYPKLINFKITERIISLLSLFLLTESGARYFITGKTLTRLNKLFHRHSLNKSSSFSCEYSEENSEIVNYLLVFIETLCKAIHKYKIDLTSHKVLKRFEKNYLSHLDEFLKLMTSSHSNDNEMLGTFKKHFNIIIKIFNYLSPFFEKCDMYAIDERIMKMFLNSKFDFLNPNNFYPFYYRELDDKGYPVTSSILLRGEETKRTNNEDIDLEERKKLLLSGDRFEFRKKSSDLEVSSFAQEKEKIEMDLFFSFFKIFIQRESFISSSNYELLEPLNKFFDFKDGDEKAMLRLFKCDKLKLKEKIIMLNVMQKLFFIERIKKESFFYLNKQITSREYIEYLFSKNINPFPSVTQDQYDEDEELENGEKVKFDLDEVELKLKIMERIDMLVKIYINEIEYFPLNLTNEKKKNITEYTTQLLKGIKRICDFFYIERNLWNKPFILLYQLALEFLPKTELFVHVIKSDSISKSFKKSSSTSLLLQRIKNVNFDLFNRDEIYKYICNSLDYIFKETNINYSFSLVKFLDVYDNTQEFNFTPFSLLETKDYEFFYEETSNENKPEDDILKEKIINKYITEFLDINSTNYLSVIQSVGNDSNKVNYRMNLIDYFKSYLNSETHNEMFDSLLCIITKTLFYDTTLMQKNFKLLLNDQFFINFNNLIQKNVYQTFILCKNAYDCDNFPTCASNTKLTLQFLQLLGEDFCTDFHQKIFVRIEGDPNKLSIFENVIKSLEQTVVFINLSKDIEAELPYDKLIVLMSNLIDFIVEFLVTKKEYSHLLQKEMDILFFQNPRMIDILKIKCDREAVTRNRIISLVKVKFIQLLISYIQNGKKINTMKKLLDNNWTPIELYSEILYNFNLLLHYCKKDIPDKIKYLLSINDNDNFVSCLVNLYIYETKFRETLELTVCFNLYILIKMYETKYNKMDIKEHFTKLELDGGGKGEKDDEDDWGLNSKNALRIYKFLEQLVLFVEVKTEGTMDPTEEVVENKEDLLLLEDEDKTAVGNGKEELKTTFFIRPFLTFFISRQTKNSFENNVDRESATAKYMGLISMSDYFLFEMVANKKMTSQSKMSKFFSDFEYTILEMFNFWIIVAHNITLIANNYKSWDLPEEEYEISKKEDFYKFQIVNLILAIVQICYIILVLIIWFRYKFCLYYENNLLKDNNMTFIYRQKQDGGQKKISKTVRGFFSETEDVSILDVISDINQDIPLYNKVYIAIFDSVLLNREICVLVYNMILLILYFCTRSSMFIVVPALFVANLSPTLFAVFKAIKTKIVTLGTVLLFTYLFVYFFMWVTYYFLPDNYIFEDVFDIKSGTQIKEAFCYSSIQCWMFIVNNGLRAGGGIADFLGKISYRTDYQFFILRFFYDMLFHLFIVLILLNVFLGIIVDAFAELRNLNWQREKDMKSICFICQLSSDDCLARNIDFDEHVSKVHNLWNYVYFLTYLHLANVNDFNRVKKYVWDKLGNQDYSWIPLENGGKEE